MAKNIIITEKPSVAQAFAHALGNNFSRRDGYVENNDWIITWCVGHLVTMSYPAAYDEKYGKWNINDLPFFPKQYKYEVIKASKKQFDVVKGLLKNMDRSSVLYNAGDAGREGEYIQRLVYTQAGVEGKITIKRIWIDSQTDEEILRGISEAKSEHEYDNLANAAYMRAIEDYSIGINLSRALSCKFGYEFNKKISSEKYLPLAVGRVMTCVLGMIVNREREINAFVPTNFYKINAFHDNPGFTSHFKAVEGTPLFNSPLLYDASGLKDKTEAEKLVQLLSTEPTIKVTKAETKIEKKCAPLLYNLAELQSDCAKKFKISPDETLAVAQRLYEAKMTTYPRTDARVLSTAISKEINKNLSGLKSSYPNADEILSNGWYKKIASSRYCDDSKITDHYAIIPTGISGSLSGIDAYVYELIVKRFLSVFYPAAEYEKTDVELTHNSGHKFFTSGKSLKKEGYLAVVGIPKSMPAGDDSSNNLMGIKVGDMLNAEYSVFESTTQPPKRYTSGSMILAMENAGNLIEDEELRAQIKGQGIGTSATRAEVIKKLCTNMYINLDKKTQILTPTKIGFEVVDIVDKNVPQMLSPKMTASWEKGLSQIEVAEITADKYKQILYNFVSKSVEHIKAQTTEQAPAQSRKIVGKCPVCCADLYETDSYYMCSGYNKDVKRSCHFFFKKEINGYTLTEEDKSQLLSGHDIGPVKMKNKEGREYSVKLVIAEYGAIKFEFPSDETTVICPSCNKALNKTSYTYECPLCGLKVWRKMSGKELTDDIIQQVINNKIAGPYDGFTDLKGNSYSAWVFIRDGESGLIKVNICGREITQSEAEQLVNTGSTDKLDGFISKKGTSFSALLKINSGKVDFDFGDNGNKNSIKKKGVKRKYSKR